VWLGGWWRRMGWTEAIIDPNHLPESRRLPRFSLAHEFHCVDGFNLLLRVLSWAGGEWKDVVEVSVDRFDEFGKQWSMPSVIYL
jgi:hypothetical protein